MAIPLLVRVPCILVAAVGLNITVTAPQPTPDAKEIQKAPSVSLGAMLKEGLGTLAIKSICWGFALADAAVTVASQFPEAKASQWILSNLVFSGNPANIQANKWFFLGTFLTAFGGYVRWKCYQALGRFFTFEMSIRKEHRLVTTGPYNWVRHPGYTGGFLTVTGIVIWHASKGSYARESGLLDTYIGRGSAFLFLALVSTIMTGLLMRMSTEDKALQETFGPEWDEYAKRVPYKLVPGIL